MKLKFVEKNEPSYLHEIEDFEKKYNIFLPIEYKTFLSTNNTGLLKNYSQFKIYIPPEEGKKNGKNLIFSVWNFFSLDELISNLEDDLLIDDNIMMHIGNLDAGAFYLCIEGENYGKIYISQVFINYMENLLYDKYLKVFDNFEEFVENIKYKE